MPPTRMPTPTPTPAFPWDETLALVRWKQTRRGYDNDAQLVRTGFSLLAPQSALLDAAEREFNVTWHRIVTEAVHFAIFLLTKAKRDDAERPEQTKHALRLLRLALNVFATRKHSEAIAIPTNSSNLLLAAMADVLEKADGSAADGSNSNSSSSSGGDELDVLLDVKHVFLYLFGLPAFASASSRLKSDSQDAAVPTFQLYKPPTNVYTDFMHRAFTASVQRLAALAEDSRGAATREYVALVRAIVVVFQELQRSQINKKKVFLAIAKTSLRDLIGYRHALVQLQTRQVAGISSVVELLDRIVVDALFDPEHIREFDGALVHTSIWRHADANGDISSRSLERAQQGGGEAKNRKRMKKSDGASALVSYQKNLFDEIKAFLSDPAVALDLKSSAGGFMEVLVRAFALRIRAAAHTKIEDTKTDLKTTKKRAATVIATASTTYSPFKFWSELCAVSFLSFQQLLESAGGDAMPLLVKLYRSLFKALCEADIYRVTEDTDEREQFEAMETILVAFLNLVNNQSRSADSADASSSLLLVKDQCQIVSNAVRCSPNLVNSSLVAIFEILGTHVMEYKSQNSSDDLNAVLRAGSDCLVDLVRSYESMRLLDRFLQASMSTGPSKRVSEGVYALFSHASCESVLRRAFMTLPPGQLEVLWTLFGDHFHEKYTASEESSSKDSVFAIGLVRFAFQIFLQELHVTPQNKAKVASLISKTHEKLFAPIVPRLTSSSSSSSSSLSFSSEERELFGLFGELLSFYDVMAAIRAETFDAILSGLKKSSLTSAMRELLAAKAHVNKKKSKKLVDSSSSSDSGRGLDSTGIIKICIFWLRKSTSIHNSSEVASVSDADLLNVALLVVDHVIEVKCWDTVAFYLPELLDAVSEEKAEQLLKELVTTYLAEETSAAVVDCPATRIVREAAFYEIRTFRAVAPRVLASLASEYESSSVSSLKSASSLFGFLLSLPETYLDISSCGDLLLSAFAIHGAIAKSKAAESTQSQEALRLLFTWLQAHFKRISMAVYKSSNSSVRKGIDAGARFVFAHAASDGDGVGKIGAPLVGDILSFYLDEGVDADKFVGELFSSLISKKVSAPVNLLRSTLVVEALADLRFSGDKSFSRRVADEENRFIESLIALLKQEELSTSLDETTSFVVLGALVKYRAATADVHTQKQQSKLSSQAQQLHLILSSQLGASLGKSMKAVVGDAHSREAWVFYANFCHHFTAFRPSVTVETYGCLLAVALSLVSKAGLSALEAEQAHRALRALVQNSNKDEYKLLLSTLAKEVSAPESARAVGALKALSLLLQGERKLSSARREYLSQHKDAIVAALIQNFSRSLASVPGESATMKAGKAELCTWNLQVFVLFFGKAELFTWKTHELAHVFIGFQPLIVATSHWNASIFSPEQIHQIWMLSYTLLLRIVRHHFASLVNGTPHIVQATNALLQLLVVASNGGDKSGFRASQFVEWSSNLARLYGYMKEHDSQLRKHVVYLMLTYLLGVTRDNLSVGLQQKLRPGVFSLLDICSTYEKEQLYAALDSTGKSLLKSLDNNYKLTHRYAGKV